MILGVLLVSKRYSFVLIALTLSLVAGCSQAEQPRAAPDTAESPAADATPQADDLAGLALTVADLPTGGWTLKPATSEGTATSTDKSVGEVCGLDFTSVFPAEMADESGTTFSREKLEQQFRTGVYRLADAERVVTGLAAELSSCTEPVVSTTNGQEYRAEIDELDGGEAAIEGDFAACRQMTMTFGYRVVSGSFCFIADGDLVVTTMTTGPSTSTVQPDEFAQLTNTATQKAFAAL